MTDDRHSDLVVVGHGAAGLSAAIAYIESAIAAGKDPRVTVLERAPKEERGGSTRWTAADFRVDKEFRLDPLWVGRVHEVSRGLADGEYTSAFEREIPRTGEFLEEHGVEVIYKQVTAPPGLTDWGNPNGGGHAIVEAFATELEASPNCEIHYRVEAINLSLSPSGEVDGVVCRDADGRVRTFHADAVVLASGGFEGNYEMLTQYLGPRAVDLVPLAPGPLYNKGEGIRMAMEIGADTAGQFDGVHAELVDSRSEAPDPVLYGHAFTIIVNEDAERFYDEGAVAMEDSFELIAHEVWKTQNSTAFMIFDEAILSREDLAFFFESDIPPVKADTIGELATGLGLDPEALERTVNEFNAACNEVPFDPNEYDGKCTEGLEPPKSNWAAPVAQAPFYGYPATTAICFTYGGLKTDTSARVLSKGGAPIRGLYAAGETAGLFYHEYPSGTSVLKALTFGRIAGEHAAQV